MIAFYVVFYNMPASDPIFHLDLGLAGDAGGAEDGAAEIVTTVACGFIQYVQYTVWYIG